MIRILKLKRCSCHLSRRGDSAIISISLVGGRIKPYRILMTRCHLILLGISLEGVGPREKNRK